MPSSQSFLLYPIIGVNIFIGVRETEMPKQGGQGKGKPKLKDKNFGKALIKQRLRDGE